MCEKNCHLNYLNFWTERFIAFLGTKHRNKQNKQFPCIICTYLEKERFRAGRERCCGIAVLGGFQDPRGQSPEQLGLNLVLTQLWAGGWIEDLPRSLPAWVTPSFDDTATYKKLSFTRCRTPRVKLRKISSPATHPKVLVITTKTSGMICLHY